jgi:hypothetical protein
MLAVTLNLASRVRRPSRRPITLANIAPTQAQAGDLAALYLRIVAAWLVGIPRIVAEYERTIAAMTTDSPSDVQGSIDERRGRDQSPGAVLTPDLRRWALQVERVHRGKWVRSVLSATDIDLDTILTAADVDDDRRSLDQVERRADPDVDAELRRGSAMRCSRGFSAARLRPRSPRRSGKRPAWRGIAVAADCGGSDGEAGRAAQSGSGNYIDDSRSL